MLTYLTPIDKYQHKIKYLEFKIITLIEKYDINLKKIIGSLKFDKLDFLFTF